MKDPQKLLKKYMIEKSKQSVSQKTRSQNPSNIFSKQDTPNSLKSRNMKSMGRKYAQQNIFKAKPQKQLRQVVISDQVVKSSKLFKILKSKIQQNDAVFVKEYNELQEIKTKAKKQVNEIKTNTYNNKLSIWELKNQILEMRNILAEQEQQNKRLEKEATDPPPIHKDYFYENQEEQYQKEEGSELALESEQNQVEEQKQNQMDGQKQNIQQKEPQIQQSIEQFNPQNTFQQKIQKQALERDKQDVE